jgi:8-oxo-dGTP pyrophosphatase MutT (NUDIX family)
MTTGVVTPQMRRRFADAEKIRVGDTALARPALRPSPDSLRAHFASDVGHAQIPIENPHLEARLTDSQREGAVEASVLLAVVLREHEPTVLVTQRHQGISYPGHWVFPGGRADPNDATPLETAVREAEEEIGLDPSRVEVLGRLGDYYSHSGFRIAPTVALIAPPFDLADLEAQPGEVEAIAEIELSRLLDSASYFLYRFADRKDRAHFALDLEGENEGVMLTGVTVSIAIGLYSELLKTHSA